MNDNGSVISITKALLHPRGLRIVGLMFAVLGSASARSDTDFIYQGTPDRFSFAQFYAGAGVYQVGITLTDIEDHVAGSESGKEDVSGAGITIGAMHYWGRADFYVTFPFSAEFSSGSTEFSYSPGVETGAKWYVTRVAKGRFSPYLGAAFSFPSFSHKGSGDQHKLVLPLSAGLTYARPPFLFDFSAHYTRSDDYRFSFSPDTATDVNVDGLSFRLGARYFQDLSIHGRKKSQDDLPNGNHFYLGIGPSTAWLTKSDDPMLPNGSIRETPAVFPELSAGFELKRVRKKGVKTLINLAYRPQSLRVDAYKAEQTFNNQALSLDLMQSFADYYGFVPFVGLSLMYNDLEYKQANERYGDSAVNWGVAFGWDILPNHTDRFYLRTMLRYYPDISISVDSHEIAFPNFEFNFIQAMYRF